MKIINLLLTDAYQITREGLKVLLENESFKIVGEASNGKEAIDFIKDNPGVVDVVIMDSVMSEMDGVEATKIITKKYPSVKVIALTTQSEAGCIQNSLDAGAKGYVLKDETNELIEAIKAVANGGRYYSKKAAATMIDNLNEIVKAYQNGTKPKSALLSCREKEILTHIAEGKTNKHVGEVLKISSRTVETHRRNMLGKLSVKNTAQMIRFAIQHKLIA